MTTSTEAMTTNCGRKEAHAEHVKTFGYIDLRKGAFVPTREVYCDGVLWSPVKD